MTFTADEPVISGECYTVVEVGGHRPAVRADFARATAMTLLRNGQTRRVIGAGVETSGTVRFHQKEPGPAGKDIRVWTITVRGDMFLGARTRILKRVPTDDPVHGRGFAPPIPVICTSSADRSHRPGAGGMGTVALRCHSFRPARLEQVSREGVIR